MCLFTTRAACASLLALGLSLSSGCGGGGGGERAAPAADMAADDAVATAQLMPAVSGLQLGAALSDDDGRVGYPPGVSLEAALGEAPIGALHGRARLSWLDLIGHAAQYRQDRAVRMMRSLYALDEDADAANGVGVGAAGRAAVGAFRLDGSDSAWRAAAEALIARAGAPGGRLPGAGEALAQFALGLAQFAPRCRDEQRRLLNPAPRCADLARAADWDGALAPAARALDEEIDRFLDSAAAAADWWPAVRARWIEALGSGTAARDWLASVLSGGRLGLYNALSETLAACVQRCDAALESRAARALTDWRAALLGSRRAVDDDTRALARHAVERVLSHGHDLGGVRRWSGQAESWQGRELLDAEAAARGLAAERLRAADADTQVVAALRLVDARFAQALVRLPADPALQGDALTAAAVSAVEHAPLVVGRAVEFSVHGTALDDTMALQLADCPVRALGGDAALRRFVCTPGGVAGQRELRVLGGDGATLYRAAVAVNAPAVVPTVSAVTPLRAAASGAQRFTVEGSGLSEALQFALEGCVIEAQSVDADGQRWQLDCQLASAAAARSGRISDGGGAILYRFSVALAEDGGALRVEALRAPATIRAGDDVSLRVEGRGFDAQTGLLSDGCQSLEISFRSAAELRAQCRGARAGSWPVTVVGAAARVPTPQPLVVGLGPVAVSAVAPLRAAVGGWVNLRVSGRNLPTSLTLALPACDAIEALGGSLSERQFGCQLERSGRFDGEVVLDGESLHRFSFVADEAPSAVVASVSPQAVDYGQELTLRVSGTSLPRSMQLELPGCALIRRLSEADTAVVFSCTPQRIGVLQGELRSADGARLKGVEVAVRGDNRGPAPVIDALAPLISPVGVLTTFTLSGQQLSAALSLHLPGCDEVVALGGDERKRQYRCTPGGEPGVRSISVLGADGAQLAAFEIELVGDEPVVLSVSPNAARLGARTVFVVRGLNLDASVGLSLAGCEARSQPGSSAFTRQFACTPRGEPGLRELRVVVSGSGQTLYKGVVNIGPAS